jgi:hypothetical protein
MHHRMQVNLPPLRHEQKLPNGSTTEMKNPAIAKNRLRIILYEQGRTGSIQRLFSWFF